MKSTIDLNEILADSEVDELRMQLTRMEECKEEATYGNEG